MTKKYTRWSLSVMFMMMILSMLIFLSGCDSTSPTASTEPTSSEVSTTAELLETTEVTEPQPPASALSNEDILYFIMVDRFADSNPDANLPDVNKDDLRAFQGGDLEGIIQKLDYIKDLGATAIWLTPIMENGPNGYHGYWIYDFYKVDPHFGDLETFKRLVKTAQDKGIKVILDYIVNHTGYNSPWLTDAEKSDWFNPDRPINNWKDKDEVELGWLAGLPDLDQTQPDVANYFIENALWWIEETGIDGFRLDTMRHVPHEFWEQFAQAIHAKHPEFFLLGEVWDQNVKTLESYHAVGIQSLTNYSLFNGIENGFRTLPNMFSLANALEKENGFSNPQLNSIFIDNHDNARFMSLNPRNQIPYLKQALTFVYTYPAIPVIYYGTEIALEGAYDPDNRRFMDWEAAENHEMVSYVKWLTELRKTYMGDFIKIHHDKASLVYEIANGADKMLIVINADEKPKEVTFNYSAKSLTDYITGELLISYDGSVYLETLEAVGIRFYIVQ